MKRCIVTLAALAVCLTSMLTAAPQAQAKSEAWCSPKSTESGGLCVTVSNPKFHEVWLDTVPIRNKSKTNIQASCGWSDTVTETMTVGYKASASATAKILELGEASVSVELSAELTMSAASSRSLAGVFTLKPGQKVFCHRTFGYYTFQTVTKEWVSSGKIYKNSGTAKIPFSLGALFANH